MQSKNKIMPKIIHSICGPVNGIEVGEEPGNRTTTSQKLLDSINI